MLLNDLLWLLHGRNIFRFSGFEVAICMPGWDLHQRVYRIAGLDVDVCSKVDRLLDEEPPTIREFAAVVPGFVVSSGEYLDERLPRHFGFRRSKFPDMFIYVSRALGRGAALCLVMHVVLDVLEDLFMRGFDAEAAESVVLRVVGDYEEECRREMCKGFEEVFATLRRILDTHLGFITDEVRRWVSERVTPLDVVLKTSGEILNPVLRLMLIAEELHGKRRTTVNMEAFRRALPAARNELKQRLLKMVAEKEIDLNRALQGVNNVRRRLEAKMTYQQLFEIVSEEAEKNKTSRNSLKQSENHEEQQSTKSRKNSQHRTSTVRQGRDSCCAGSQGRGCTDPTPTPRRSLQGLCRVAPGSVPP